MARSIHFVTMSKLCAWKIHITESKLSFSFGLNALKENLDPCILWFLWLWSLFDCACNTLALFSMFTMSFQVSWMPHCGNRNRPVVAQGSILRNWDTCCISSNKFKMQAVYLMFICILFYCIENSSLEAQSGPEFAR